MNRRFRKRAETRDAVVWDFDDANKIVRCKIQGSDEYILCHYPRNWQTLPAWCRRGNAVRIAHKGGIRGYMEVIGHGRAVPTPVSGSQFPTAETLYDGILTGGAISPYSGMQVKVGPTTYRIDGSSYSLTPDGMDVRQVLGLDALLENAGLRTLGLDAKLVTTHAALGFDALVQLPDQTLSAGLDALLQSGFASVTLDAAPASPQVRYDLLAAGTDNALNVVKGTAAADPALPSLPADHVKIGHILVIGDITTILEAHINATWETRRLADIAWSLSSGSGTIDVDGQFEYEPEPGSQTPYCAVAISIADQYGWDFSAHWQLTFEFLYGTGGMSLSSGGPFAQTAITKSIPSGYQQTIYYQRDQGVSEVSPTIQVSVAGQAGELGSSANRIQLLSDVGGLIE